MFFVLLQVFPSSLERIISIWALLPISKPFSDRDDVLGPFPTKRAATDAAKRAVATPEDSRIGLFAATMEQGTAEAYRE